MLNSALTIEIADFLHREALHLDRREWRQWLDLYAEDAVFWVPSFTLEGEPVSDPELSVNLIYVTGQSGLEDRVFRLDTEESLASSPLPRTSHLIGSVRAEEDGDDLIEATAAFQVAVWSLKRGPESRSGRYEYRLIRDNGDLKIKQKKILLVDEVIDGWFDFFSI